MVEEIQAHFSSSSHLHRSPSSPSKFSHPFQTFLAELQPSLQAVVARILVVGRSSPPCALDRVEDESDDERTKPEVKRTRALFQDICHTASRLITTEALHVMPQYILLSSCSSLGPQTILYPS